MTPLSWRAQTFFAPEPEGAAKRGPLARKKRRAKRKKHGKMPVMLDASGGHRVSWKIQDGMYRGDRKGGKDCA